MIETVKEDMTDAGRSALLKYTYDRNRIVRFHSGEKDCLVEQLATTVLISKIRDSTILCAFIKKHLWRRTLSQQRLPT